MTAGISSEANGEGVRDIVGRDERDEDFMSEAEERDSACSSEVREKVVSESESKSESESVSDSEAKTAKELG